MCSIAQFELTHTSISWLEENFTNEQLSATKQQHFARYVTK